MEFFVFIPLVKRLLTRKYYASGIATYRFNSFCKRILYIGGEGDFLLHFTSRINSPQNFRVLDGTQASTVYLSLATSGVCYYQAINGIEIGAGTIWANNCSFISANHSYKDLSTHEKSGKISIGENVWIGSNCVVLPGVRIGSNSIVRGALLLQNLLKRIQSRKAILQERWRKDV